MHLNQIMNSEIYQKPLSEIKTEKRCIINTINPHSYCESKKDTHFEKALLESDVLLPDGSGIVLATKILAGKKINKIAGADVHQYLLEQANAKSLKVFYLGAAQNTLDLIQKRIGIEYPNIKVSSFSPPFKSEFSNEDTLEMLEKVNAFQSDILFVGMTAPKQEKWVDQNNEFINAKIIEETGDEWAFNEGCLSIPDIREDVFRQEKVTIEYLDEKFEKHTDVIEGIAARIVQHEYDHIEGILFTDLISTLKKRLIKKKLENISKGKVNPDYRMKFPLLKRK